MFSIKNATILALLQVGIIVMGVLASGLWHKASITNNLTMPAAAAWLYQCGVFALAIPPVWITVALLIRRRPDFSDELKELVFWSGVLLFIGLVGFVIYADVIPCFHLPSHSPSADDV
jgi:hypothetical protein